MYLGKYKADRTNPIVRRALADRQNLHCAIQKMFGTDRKSSNVLYRLNGDSIYISADKTPEPIEGFDFIGGREINAVSNGIHKFSIITIPRKGVSHKKYILKTEEARLEWLMRQALNNGFEIMSVREMGNQPIISHKKHFDVTAYRYDGVLRVTDSEKFNEVLLKGLGTMKAYGCGMLVVA